ncbi:MAG: PAS domain S-box protein, partial [Sneathiella sp.]
MEIAPIPEYEDSRLEVLRGLDILDTGADEGFDRLTRIVKSHFEVPIVLVSLVDEHRQWFKSRQGLDACETPRDISFCGHAILGDDIFYIPDAKADARFQDNPLVTGPPGIQFYAGVPLSAEGGLKVGTLCVIDTKPRQFNSDQFIALKDFGDCVEQQLVQSRLHNDAKFLVSQTSRLNTLLEAVADGIVTIDNSGIIESVNTEAAHIFGYEPYELVGQNFGRLMPDLGRGGWNGYVEIFFGEDRKDERADIKEFMGLRKDGSLFPMDLSVREMFLEGTRLFTGIIRDVTDRKAVEDEIRRGREVLEAMKENIPVGISVFDEILNLSVINDLAIKFLNFPEELSKLGTAYEDCTWHMVQRGDFGEGSPETILEKQMDFAYNPKPRRIVNSFGGDRQIEVSTRPMPGGGVVSIYSDITDRLRNEEKLESLLKQANSASQAKSDFLSTMSHEIRTPLNGVIGVARMLGDTDLNDDQLEKLDAILRSGTSLLDLINDVLDMSKIEAGNLEIEAVPFDLVDIVSTVKIPFDIQAQDKKIEFSSHIAPEIAECFVSDPTRIRQITMNLLSNAFKFTEEGSVHLTVIPEGGITEGIQNILISVQDSGVGNPEDRQAAFFDLFSQAHTSVA